MTENPRIPGGSRASGDGMQRRSGWFARFLIVVEWLGNLLPHPVTLFALFALGVVLLSGVAGYFEWQVADPRPEGTAGRTEDGIIRAVSLMNGDGFRRIIENLVTNFTGFVPLGTVLVALLGVGVAEKSGLLSAAIRLIILGAPKTFVTAALVFAGVVSNTASEMGYVVIVPMGAAIFYSLGRHPLAGLAAAFAGVSGGYSANILIGTVDPLLAGITQEAARMLDPAYEVHPAVNWYFMIASTFLITALGTFVTAKIVEPKLGAFDDSRAEKGVENIITIERLAPAERRALKWAALAAGVMVALFVYFAGPHSTVEAECERTSLVLRRWISRVRACSRRQSAGRRKS
ncbi:MAG TPA: AbgT family transporter [Phycisphaerales bacterium]|nr:AbgT family transporter [Phycisphaerales bacterium]